MNTRVLESISHIIKERKKQDEQWGGAEHDDTHNTDDWFGFIEHQIQKYKEAPTKDRYSFYEPRERLVKIAALAVAGIESIDRKEEHNGINDHK